jgi:hypothetical protein
MARLPESCGTLETLVGILNESAEQVDALTAAVRFWKSRTT